MAFANSYKRYLKARQQATESAHKRKDENLGRKNENRNKYDRIMDDDSDLCVTPRGLNGEDRRDQYSR